MARLKQRLSAVRWDKLWQRAANIAVVLGVPIALLTLWFTIVPLYRIAALDEQIAKQRQELERLYAESRDRAVIGAVMRIGPYCTGLMDPPEFPQAAKRLADTIAGKPVEPEEKVASWERRLTTDVRSCLLDNAGNLDKFKAQDKAVFMSELRAAADRIARDQQESLKRARELPAQAHNDPSVLPPPDDYVTIQRWNLRRLPEAEVEARVLETRIETAQAQIEVAWSDRTRDTLMTLSKVRWPE